jgi:hypothetical protein
MEKVVALAPVWGQGDTVDNPNPMPRRTSTTAIVLEAMPPPKIAAHEIAETDDSVRTSGSPVMGP